MIGQIESYDPETQTGVIKTEDASIKFHFQDWLAHVAPEEGDEVSFEQVDSVATQINLVGAYLSPEKPVRYRFLAILLAVVLGWLGMHRFYLGFYRIGFFQLSLTIILYVVGAPGFAALWGFIDGILLLGGHIYQDAKGRPLKEIKWRRRAG